MTVRGQTDSAPEEPRSRSRAEWVTLAFSIILIVGMVGLVTYLVVMGGDRPPVITAAPRGDLVRQESGAYYLPIEVTNSGERTAEAVVVRAEVTGDAGEAETAEFTLDFLAGGETAEGTVLFTTDPGAGELAVAVVSFLPS